MKKILSAALLAIGCAAPQKPEKLLALAPNLYRVQLPAGLVPGFDVMFRGDNHVKYTLPAGYDGFEFVGMGAGVTHVKAPYSPTEWHNSSIFVGPFDGPVVLRDMTIHGARDKGVHFGLATVALQPDGSTKVVRPVLPNFKLTMIDCEVVADKEADGKRPKWGVFLYQADLRLVRVRFEWKEGVEHAVYQHGFALSGSVWNQVEVQSSGAENDKTRNDNQEIQWVPGAKIIRKLCTYRDWYQPWSWRGGAGIVIQGSGAERISISNCQFWGAPGQRGRCISIDDGGTRVDGRPDYYDAFTGAVGGQYANGDVVVNTCAFFGGPGLSSYSDLMTFVNWHGRGDYPHKPARAVLVTGCGAWGDHMLGKFGNQSWSVANCNTPLVRDQCEALGMDVSKEAQINGNPLVPFSQGRTVLLPGDVLPSSTAE